MNFYNENDPKAAAWLRALIEAGLIPDGFVVEESIENLTDSDLDACCLAVTQAHFFAGIGGWSYALQLAGWPEDRPVWTGSCPCQPFSIAGNGKGTDDERHLWPVWRELIAQHRPPTIFGEQVASPLGREWLSGVRDDLEALGYEVGAADLCAAGVGAPHRRQRLFWVGHADSGQCGGQSILLRGKGLMGKTQKTFQAPWDGQNGTIATLYFSDHKKRRAQSTNFPLAPRLPGHVVKLRGLGNAIVPQVAATFIRAFMETTLCAKGSEPSP